MTEGEKTGPAATLPRALTMDEMRQAGGGKILLPKVPDVTLKRGVI